MVTAYALLNHPIGNQPADHTDADLELVLGTSGRAREVRRLLQQMTAPHPSGRPRDLVDWSDRLADVLEQSESVGGRRWVGPAIATCVLAIGAAAVMLTGSSSDENDPSPPPAISTDTAKASPPCTSAIGEPDVALTDDEQTEVRSANATLVQLSGDACGAAPASLFGEAVFQSINDGGLSEVVVSSPGGAVRMSAAEWTSYREIAGRQRPENAITFGGYPVRAEAGSATHIDLAAGGLLVGRRDDTQSFWMPEPVLALWLEQGGADGELGYPMTNPFYVTEGVQQDFEGGYMVLPAETTEPIDSIDPSLLVVHRTKDRGAPLEGIDIRNSIIRQPTGTSWWVDQDGERHWLPDGDTYMCVGGDEILVANELPGSAIATVPLGPPATCTSEG